MITEEERNYMAQKSCCLACETTCQIEKCTRAFITRIDDAIARTWTKDADRADMTFSTEVDQTLTQVQNLACESNYMVAVV